MGTCGVGIIRARVWRVCLVGAVAVLLCGCAGSESVLEENFPSELVGRARSDFGRDMTDWQVAGGGTVGRRVRLILYSEPGVRSDVRDFCELKLVQNLKARGFEPGQDEDAQMVVCIVRAWEMRRPVRAAKVRIAASFRRSPEAEPILLGIADGIVARPDLSSGVGMPKSCYLRAGQLAVSKLMQQLSGMARTP